MSPTEPVAHPRPSRIATFVAHHVPYPIAVSIAALFVGELWFPNFWATMSFTLASNLLVFLVVRSVRRHAEVDCAQCAYKQEDDDGVRKSWALTMYHRDSLLLGMIVLAAGVVIAIIYEIAQGEKFGFWVVKGPAAIVFILIGLHLYASVTHFTYQQKCPVCRDNGDEDEPSTPTPTPRVTVGV